MNKAFLIALLGMVLVPTGQLFAQQASAPLQYVYVLQLAPRFHDQAAWTDTENAVIERHFERLAQAARSGQVILAGRTREPLDKTFGLVIFEAESESEAQEFMRSDPAVLSGLMTATLHPYAVALLGKGRS